MLVVPSGFAGSGGSSLGRDHSAAVAAGKQRRCAFTFGLISCPDLLFLFVRALIKDGENGILLGQRVAQTARRQH